MGVGGYGRVRGLALGVALFFGLGVCTFYIGYVGDCGTRIM